MSLIEVLISFFLVIICILPLLYPHFYILHEKNEFIKKIELDHQINLIYGKILEQLYLKKISWNDLTNGKTFEITSETFPEEKLIYPGNYSFKVEKIKYNEDKTKIAALFNLTFNFQAKSKTLIYNFKIFAMNHQKSIEQAE